MIEFEYLVYMSVLYILTYLGSSNSDFDIKTPKKNFFFAFESSTSFE